MHQKLALDHFLILLNNQRQPLHARKSFKNKTFWKKKKKSNSLKKVKLLFLSNPVSFNGQSYQKQKGSGTSDQLLSRLQNKFRKIPLFVIYDLNKFDDVKQFLSYSKNYICKFMQGGNSWHRKLFHFHLYFWIWKVGKLREKNTKIWISWKLKELFRWNKKCFTVLKGLSFGEKIKIWWKIIDTSFKAKDKKISVSGLAAGWDFFFMMWSAHPFTLFQILCLNQIMSKNFYCG